MAGSMVVVPSRSAPGGTELSYEVACLVLDAASAFETASDRFLDGDLIGASAALQSARGLVGLLATLTVDERAALLARAVRDHPTVIDAEAPQMTEAVRTYDTYFLLARVTNASAVEVAIGAVPMLGNLADDLPTVSLPLDDRALLAHQAAETLAGPHRATSRTQPTTPTAAPSSPLAPLARWKVGHGLFGLANRAAAATLITAAQRLATGDDESAAADVRAAACHVRAVTASMDLAAATTRPLYEQVIRPTMRRPQLALELTGFQNLDYKAYKAALDTFLAACDQPFPQVAQGCRSLADARDELLHADLSDRERHVSLTHRLVGHLPALDEDPAGSAVQALRATHAGRLAKYSSLLRHGYLTTTTSPSAA